MHEQNANRYDRRDSSLGDIRYASTRWQQKPIIPCFRFARAFFCFSGSVLIAAVARRVQGQREMVPLPSRVYISFVRTD